jgi:hypothetical protein
VFQCFNVIKRYGEMERRDGEERWRGEMER